jgi:hypothetical protein
MATGTSYRIVCVSKAVSTGKAHSSHISAVGTGLDPEQSSRNWTVPQVYAEIALNDTRFYTVSKKTGKPAEVDPYECCGIKTLRSPGDTVTDNNLDTMRLCRTAQ